MKGNEARVVFYINPVDEVFGREVSKVKPLSTTMLSLILFVFLLGCGVLLYLFVPTGRLVPPSKLQESETEENRTTCNKEPYSTSEEKNGTIEDEESLMDERKGALSGANFVAIDEGIERNITTDLARDETPESDSSTTTASTTTTATSTTTSNLPGV